jgi:hypothetical protein
MLSIRSGSARVPVAPLVSLFALFLLAMTWVVSSRICARPVAMAMPMDGMPMSAMPAGGVMLCPVVVVMIVLSTLAAAWALLAMWRDPHRSLDAANLARMLARLPIVPTVAVLLAGGALGAGAIVAVDGGALLSFSLCATLVASLGAMSLAATLGSLALARFALALCARLLRAVERAIARRPSATFRYVALAPRVRSVRSAIDFGRGLRAPPSPVR